MGAEGLRESRVAKRLSAMRAFEGRRHGTLEIGRPVQQPMSLWPKSLDLRFQRCFERSVRCLNGDRARPGIGDGGSLADALDLRTLLREFASAQDRARTLDHMCGPPDAQDIGSCRCLA